MRTETGWRSGRGNGLATVSWSFEYAKGRPDCYSKALPILVAGWETDRLSRRNCSGSSRCSVSYGSMDLSVVGTRGFARITFYRASLGNFFRPRGRKARESDITVSTRDIRLRQCAVTRDQKVLSVLGKVRRQPAFLCEELSFQPL
jgi:hypothetical protein